MPPYADHEKEKAKKRKWYNAKRATDPKFKKREIKRTAAFQATPEGAALQREAARRYHDRQNIRRAYVRFNLDDPTDAKGYIEFTKALAAAGIRKVERTHGVWCTVSAFKSDLRKAGLLK